MKEKTLEADAGAVFDLLEIGPAARLDHVSPTDLDACRHALTAAGILNAARSLARGPGWMVLDLHRDIDGVTATAVAELHIAPAGADAYRITQRSTVRLQPLDYLSHLNGGTASRTTYDGKTNYIGPTPADTCHLIEHQYRYAASMVDELCRCLDQALPKRAVTSEVSMRLRRAELCRDRTSDDPPGAALLLCHSVPKGTLWLERGVYRAAAADERGHLVVRWWRKRKGAAYKVYAKAPASPGCPGGLREEVSCQGRKALEQLGCQLRAEWTEVGVVELLSGFATAALPLLDTLDRHVTEVLHGGMRPSDLFAALSPLVMPMSGAPTGGRPTSPEQVAQLRYAFDRLVLAGQYRGKGLKKGLTLRSILDSLCGSDGPLEKHPSLCFYVVKPQFVSANRALALVCE
ncbi:hypothetical protein [Sphingomonas faeni]|uniref:hypothetical protein n=1 Tax=Sphingomonas faeni TaxID=185950 RepID=UPI00336380C2